MIVSRLVHLKQRLRAAVAAPACGAQFVHRQEYTRHRKLLARGIVLVTAMSWSLTAGAATIREVVNSSPQLCHQFESVLKTAGVPNMTDAQLCKFQFDQLPASMTTGFAFPQWTKLQVSDPLEMYKRMVLANWRTDWAKSVPPQDFFGNYIEGQYESYKAVVQASDADAVTFYTAILPAREWSGVNGVHSNIVKFLPKHFYMVQMRLSLCTDKASQNVTGNVYAASYQPNMEKPVDASSLSGYLILWRDSLFLIHVGGQWIDQPVMSRPTFGAEVTVLQWHPSSKHSKMYRPQPYRAGFSAGPTVCSYSIDR